jgi:hypothetical protein
MGMRSGTTFKKRQKEIARMEKQRDKFAKRLQRKTEKAAGGLRWTIWASPWATYPSRRTTWPSRRVMSISRLASKHRAGNVILMKSVHLVWMYA